MKKNIQNLLEVIGIIILCFIFVLFFSCSISPILPCWSLDSHMFQELGLALLHGKIPYVDLFDQKGFYLFFYNALGLSINKAWGLSFLQSLNFAFCIFFIISAIETITSNQFAYWKKLLIALCFLGFDFGFEGGNTCEDCNLLFIIIPIYLSIRAICNGTFELGKWQLFCIGGCAGCTLFIRANNYMPVIGFLIVLLFFNIYKKRIKYCITSIGIAFVGFVVLLLPCIFYFAIKGGVDAINEMWYGTFVSNVQYAAKDSLFDLSFPLILKSFFCNLFFVVISFLLWNKNRLLSIAFLLSIIIGSLFIGHALYRHYYIIFIPVFCILMFSSNDLLKKYRILGLSSIVIFLITINPIIRYVDLVSTGSSETKKCREEFSRVIQIVPQKERQDIWNLNAMSSLDLLVSQDIVQANRFMVPWHSSFFSRFKDVEIGKFQKVNPKWVLLDRKFTLNELDYITVTNNYYPIDSLSRMGNGSTYVLYMAN